MENKTIGGTKKPNMKPLPKIRIIEDKIRFESYSNFFVRITFKSKHNLGKGDIIPLSTINPNEDELKQLDLRVYEIENNRSVLCKYPEPAIYIATFYEAEYFNKYKVGQSYWQGFFYNKKGNRELVRVDQQNIASTPSVYKSLHIVEMKNISLRDSFVVEDIIHAKLSMMGLKPEGASKEWVGTGDPNKPCYEIIRDVVDGECEKFKAFYEYEELVLRKHQTSYQQWRESLIDECNSVIHHIMRSGKTITFSSHCYNFYKKGFYKNSNLILMIVPQQNLATSTEEDIYKYDPKAQVLNFCGEGTTNITELENFIKREGGLKFLVITVHSYLRHLKFLEKIEWAEIFIDEIFEYVGELNSFGPKSKSNRFRLHLWLLVNQKSSIRFQYLTVAAGTMIDRSDPGVKGVWCNDFGPRHVYDYDQALEDGVCSPFTLNTLLYECTEDTISEEMIQVKDCRIKSHHRAAIYGLAKIIINGGPKKWVVRVNSKTQQDYVIEETIKLLKSNGYNIDSCAFYKLNCKTNSVDRKIAFKGNGYSEVEIAVVIGVGRIGSTYPYYESTLLLDPFNSSTEKGLANNLQFIARHLGSVVDSDGNFVKKHIYLPIPCYRNEKGFLVPYEKSSYLSVFKALRSYARKNIEEIVHIDPLTNFDPSGILTVRHPKERETDSTRSVEPGKRGGEKTFDIIDVREFERIAFSPVAQTKIQTKKKGDEPVFNRSLELLSSFKIKAFNLNQRIEQMNLGIFNEKPKDIWKDLTLLEEEIKTLSEIDSFDYYTPLQEVLEIMKSEKRNIILNLIS